MALKAPPHNPRAGTRGTRPRVADASNPFAADLTRKPKPPPKHVNFPAQLTTVINPEDVEGPAENFVLYQTLYKFTSDDPEDLQFEANEILQITDEGDGTEGCWLYGQSQDGREGNVPGTYVRKIRLTAKTVAVDVENGVVEKAAEPKRSASPMPVAPRRELQPHQYTLYQALYDYTSTDPEDLCFKAGDILRITEPGATPEDWFFGQDQDGNEGNFPGTYIRKIGGGGGRKVVGGLEHT
eukprot:TRINITY_DN7645_c0_g1_i1.p1 TRINITY_DN7645_c0_g1~~TRINITY_DN7645_c0_g1_i1.p1  ORF type:complete len:240 (+),score=34.20 TRINITY_DN7645_c0_g1_i1:175-894(+)